MRPIRSVLSFFAASCFATAILVACATPATSTLATTYPDGPAGTIAVDGAASKTVATLFGENYWCWDGYGDNMPKTQALVTPLKLDVLRAGGYNNDAEKSTGAYGSDPFGDSQIDAFVAYCKAVGAEPLIQVPLIDNYKKNGTANPADAAAIVAYCKSKGYGVKYWEIGNEPDLYGSVNNGVTDIPGYTVDKFIADFKARLRDEGGGLQHRDPGPRALMEVLPQPAKERRERLAYALPRSMPRLLRHRYDTPLSVLRGPVQHRPRRSSLRYGWPTLSAPLASRGSGPRITGVSRSPGPSASSIRAT